MVTLKRGNRLLLAGLLGLAPLGAARMNHAAEAAEANANAPLVLVIEAPPEVLDPDVTRAAVEQELGLSVVAPDTPGVRGVLRIRTNAQGDFIVAYEPTDREGLVRTIRPPEDPSRAPEVVALLAGNLVRSEAEQLLEQLRAREKAQAAADEAASEVPPPPGPAVPEAAQETPEPAAPKKEEAPKPAQPRAPAQPDPGPSGTVQSFGFSFFHPLAHPKDTELHQYRWHFGFAYGHLGGLSGFSLAALVTAVDGDAEGVYLNGIGGYTGGNGRGVRLGGLGNFGRGTFSGVEIAGIGNAGFGQASGAQIAGIANFTAERRQGIQVAMVANVAGVAHYGEPPAQTDAANESEAALENGSDEKTPLETSRGVQVAGIGNAAAGGFQGIQIAGIGNGAAGGFRGAQLAGITNLALDELSGVQLSLVNIGMGTVRGAQIGLVNYARELDGVSIGLVPVSRNGRVQAVAWASSTLYSNLGVRFLNGPVYTLLHTGYTPEGADNRVALGAYLGGHIPIQRFSIDLDVGFDHETVFNASTQRDEYIVRYRAALGFQVAKKVGLFAGGGVWERVPSKDVADWRHRGEAFGGVAFF